LKPATGRGLAAAGGETNYKYCGANVAITGGYPYRRKAYTKYR